MEDKDMATNTEFQRLLNGSKQYEFEGTVLTITGYYNGKRIAIDLGQLTEEMFEELVVEDEDEDDEKRRDIYNVVSRVQYDNEGVVDQLSEDITDAIIEDNGYDLDEDEIIEIAEQYFEEED